MLWHLLSEGLKGLSPESVSCGAKTNQNLEDGLWVGTGRGLREVSVCGASVGLSLRTGEGHPERQMFQL